MSSALKIHQFPAKGHNRALPWLGLGEIRGLPLFPGKV